MSWYILTYKWVLAIKYRMLTLYSREQKKQNKRDCTSKDAQISLRNKDKIVIKGRWRVKHGLESG